MKKIFLSIIITCLLLRGSGQLTIGSDAQWVTTGNATLVVNDMNLLTHGIFTPGTGSVKFTGTQNNGITGINLPVFNILEIAKTNNAKIQLARDINVNASINFISGLLDVWSSKIVLSPTAYVAGESETNRITATGAGFTEITVNLNSPNMNNPGNLGAFITSTENLGSVIVRRFHLPASGTGLSTSINRYYNITPTNNTNLNATLRLKYFDAELNAQNESSLVLYQAFGAGSIWNNLSRTSNSTNSNYVEKTGLANLALQTLANDNTVAGAVTGLTFTGQRKKATEVQLNWTSQTETNMSGYRVQRRLDNELDFSDRAFVNTLAAGGNSISPLNYMNVDANAHTGISYYRLKVIAADNSFTYSIVISVGPKTKGVKGGGNPNNLVVSSDETIETATSKIMSSAGIEMNKEITVGPNPNYGNFWFKVNGLEKETEASLFTIDGKLIKKFRIINLQQQPVNSLSSGIYILKVPGYDAQKIIVQGNNKNASQSNTTTDYNIKN